MPPEQQACAPYDFWLVEPPDIVNLTCLMPNGIIIPMTTSQNATIEELKEELWENAARYPLFGFLHNKSEYVVSVISNFGKKAKAEEINDETVRLCDVQPYFCILKIAEKTKSTDNPLEKDITHLIGKPVEDFKSLNNPEVNDFRYKMGVVAERVSNERKRMTWQERLTYQYPPRLAKNINIPQAVRGRFNNDKFMIVSRSENDPYSFTHEVFYNLSPTTILIKILDKMSKRSDKSQSSFKQEEYIIKICGQDEYIFGDNQIIQFLHVQDVLAANGIPSFVIQARSNVDLFKESIYDATPMIEDRKSENKLRSATSTCTLKKKQKNTSSWDIKQQLQITIHEIKGLNCDMNKAVEVGIQVGLFHGGKSLCEPQKTSQISLLADGCANWDEVLKFDIMVYNVPRMARLCLVVYEVSKSSKGSSNSGTARRRTKDSKYYSMNPIAWVNTTVFDYKHQLKTGAMTLYTWTYAEDSQSDDWLHPLGTVESNPRTDERAAIMLSICE